MALKFNNSDQIRVVIKGAPEYIIPMCKTQISGSGNI